MNVNGILTLITSTVLLFSTLSAQPPGCPQIDAGANGVLPCTQNCATLTANVVQTGATTSYAVASIPYAPPFAFTGGTKVFVNEDDIWSDVIQLPFNFCFYGNTYTSAVIGANGLISFDVSQALDYCEYAFDAPIPTPGPPPAGIYNNSINGAYHDIDPSVPTITFFPPSVTYSADINYAVIGTAPCRTFVVNFSTVPHYDCNNLRTTQQIVIYETTNVIEVYIKDKPTCNSWNDGNAVIGLQNIDGTQGITPPNRNTGPWTASNEAWRFTPNGTTIVTVEWFDGTTLLGTGTTYTACPSANTTYTARATYLPCAGGTPVVVSDNVTLTLQGLSAGIDSSRNVSCFGGSDGYARAFVTGGVAPVNYGWSNGSGSLVQNNLAAGTYIFTATDAGNCTRRDTVIIGQTPQVTVNVPDTTVSNCAGTANASFIATPGGGTGPYTYVWNTTPPQTSQSVVNVPPGSYVVTVTDSRNCTASDGGTLTVQQVNNLNITLDSLKNVTCNGAADGRIVVTPANGSAPFSFSWNTSPVQTTSTASNLPPGSYTVSVSDVNGCTNSATYTITQPAALNTVIDTTVNISCNGSNDGFIRTTTTGGSAPYTYSWNTTPVKTTDDISALTAGPYTLIVQDNSGCTATRTATITEPQPLIVNITASQNASCFGRSDGSATVSVSGGTTPYVALWNTTPVQTTPVATNLPAGFYSVLVVDDNNCSLSDTITITQPAQIALVPTNAQNISCFGLSDGSATVNASGGSVPFQYAWSSTPPQNTATAQNLPAGTYQVTATDASGCTTSISVALTEPAQIDIDTLAFNNISCFGLQDAAFAIQASGGALPLTYQWNNATVSGTAASQLGAGSYVVTVADNNNCSSIASFDVVEPAQLTATVTKQDVNCFGQATGSATVNAAGGSAPFGYNWSNSQTSATALGIAAGFYSVTVTDSRNCSVTDTITLTQPPLLSLTLLNSADVSCFGLADGNATVEAAGGTLPYSFAWNTQPVQTTAAAQNIVAGSYQAVVTDALGCTAAASAVINQPTQLSISFTSTTNVLCFGELTGAFTTQTNGGTPAYTYVWNNPNITGTAATQVAAGSYDVTVTDDNNCTATVNAIITEPSLLSAAVTKQDVSCYGYNNGSVQVAANGGTGTYTYTWTGINNSTADATALGAGVYAITVTDQNNCSADVSATVIEPEQIVITIERTVKMEYGEVVTLNNTIAGGKGILNYLWTPETGLSCTTCQEPVATPVKDVIYTYLVTDEDGCFDTDSVFVEVYINKDIYIPNTFTPNGDGSNDFFFMFAKKLRTFSMKVFNRWGEKVFDSYDLQQGWDGYFNGKPADVGVYTYLTQFVFPDGQSETRKGSLLLMR